MSFRVCVVLSIALLPVRPTTAQYGGTDDPSWLYRTWTVEDGLPSNVVQVALHTSDEFLWLGTLAGLVRFDGQQFTVFDKSNVPGWQSDAVYDLLEDERGVLWAASLGGLVRYGPGQPPDSSAFRVYSSADGLPSDATKALAETTDGTLWVGSYGGGLSAVRNGAVVRTFGTEDGLLSEAIWVLEDRREGGLWIGTDAGVARYREGRFDWSLSGEELPDQTVRSLYEAPDGRLWIGTNQGGITIVEDDHVVGHFTAADLGTNNAVSAIRGAPDGSVWVATTGGLSYLKDETWTRVPIEKSGLEDPFVWDVHFGSGGIRWIATDLGGLVQLRPASLEVIGEADGLPDANLYAILQDRAGRLWLGTGRAGARIRSSEDPLSLRAVENLPHASATALFEDRLGHVWVGMMGGGVARTTDTKLDRHYTMEDGLVNDFVRALAEGPVGTVWAGTNDGISLIAGDSLRPFPLNSELPSPSVLALHLDQEGRMWIGTTGGLARVGGDSLAVYMREDGLGDNVILSIEESADGTIWVGTRDGGLARIAGESVTTYGRADGLLTDEVHAVLDDGRGSLWISSMRGIYRVSVDELDAVDQGSMERFRSRYLDRSDGLPSLSGNRAYGSTAARMNGGRLAFTTDAGAVLLDPASFDSSSGDLPTRLQRFLVNGRPIDPAAGNALLTSDKLELHFTALNFSAPERTRFRYRLVGLEADWIEAGSRTVAFYNNLPAGSYTFLLDATNASNQWRSEPVAVPFRVSAPWYRSWWAIAFYGLFAIGTLVPATRYVSYRRLQRKVRRLETERRVQQERERISRDLHDNVGAQLSNLISGIELINLHTESGALDEAASCLRSLDGDARASIAQLRETIWALHHEEIAASDLRNQIHRFAEVQTRYRDRPVVSCIIEDGGERVLSSIQALHLFRIAQEAIHNSLKYSEAERLRIRLAATEREIELAVEDDGSFKAANSAEADTDTGTERFGLAGMRRRVEELGGTCSLTTDGGTRILVRAPLGEDIP